MARDSRYGGKLGASRTVDNYKLFLANFLFFISFGFDQWKRMFSTKKLFKGHYQSEDDDNDDGGVWTQQQQQKPSDFFLVKLIPVNHFVKQTEFQMSFCCFFYW